MPQKQSSDGKHGTERTQRLSGAPRSREDKQAERLKVLNYQQHWQGRCRGALDKTTVNVLGELARLLWRMEASGNEKLTSFARYKWRAVGEHLTTCVRGATRRNVGLLRTGQWLVRRDWSDACVKWRERSAAAPDGLLHSDVPEDSEHKAAAAPTVSPTLLGGA